MAVSKFIVSTGIVLSTLVAGAAAGADRIRAADLRVISMTEEVGPRGEPSAVAFQEIVSRGLDAVPALAHLLADATPTGQSVPLFGGEYAVGDVAMRLLNSIIDFIPWLSFIPDTGVQSHDQGFLPYWHYVRESPAHRREMRRKFKEWYRQHAAELVWQAGDELTPGSFVLRDDPNPQ